MNYYIDLFLQKLPRRLKNQIKMLAAFVYLGRLILKIKNLVLATNLFVM